jgi:hypothetical protein
MSGLEFGIFDSFGPFEMAEFPTVADVYEAHIREAQEAEQLGYRYYFFIEHQNSPVCSVTSPNVYLTALASRTSALRFGLMIYHPGPDFPWAAGIRYGHRGVSARIYPLEPAL